MHSLNWSWSSSSSEQLRHQEASDIEIKLEGLQKAKRSMIGARLILQCFETKLF